MNINQFFRKKAEDRLSHELQLNWINYLDKITVQEFLNLLQQFPSVNKGHDIKSVFGSKWDISEAIRKLIFDKLIDTWEHQEVLSFCERTENPHDE